MTPSAPPIVFDRVWKRYQIGSQHDSLRDAIPALFRQWFGRNGHEAAAGEFWALKDVTFHVAKGETLGIVGPNGAGKSTILKLLSKIIKQTQGAVRLEGRLAALIELGSGFHPDLTGTENIYLQGTMLGISHREIKRLFDAIVGFSEIGPFLDTPVKRYSSGMVVRLGFAIAAQVQPEVLLLDEVLAVGDLAFQQKCFKRIAELKQVGTTTIFISHNLEAVEKLCDRVLLLRQGQVLCDGEPADMLRRYREDALSGSLTSDPSPMTVSQNGPFTIRQVTLRAADGSGLEELATGEPLAVEIGFSASRAIKHPAFRVSLERIDGLLCHATSSRPAGLLPDVLSGEGAVTVTYPALNLLPNVYQVTVEVFEDDNPIPLATVRQRCFFQITSDHHERGTVHLEHAWSLSDGRA